MLVRGPRDACDETSRTKLAEKYMRVGKAISIVFGVAVAVFGVVFILRGFGVYLW